MSHFRSLLFYFFFLTGTILFFSFFSPVKFFSYKVTVKLSRFWSKSVIYLAKYILNINYRVYGLKNLPKDGNYLIVSNHQSAWETVFFSYYFSCPVFILKEELKKIPIFSWYFEKLGFIYINREDKFSSLKHVVKSINLLIGNGRKSFVIFPEGTRVQPNQKVKLNPGFFAIHKMTGLPILPLVHNSGVFWKNKRFKKKRGDIKIRIFPMIKNLRNKNLAKKKIEDIFKISDQNFFQP